MHTSQPASLMCAPRSTLRYKVSTTVRMRPRGLVVSHIKPRLRLLLFSSSPLLLFSCLHSYDGSESFIVVLATIEYSVPGVYRDCSCAELWIRTPNEEEAASLPSCSSYHTTAAAIRRLKVCHRRFGIHRAFCTWRTPRLPFCSHLK
jgi:hypothetical protein